MLALAAALSVLVSPPAGGFAAPTAQLTEAPAGVTVHGAVCRRQNLGSPAPWGVRLQVMDAEGGVRSTVTTPLVGAGLSGRALGCAYYTAHLTGAMSPGDRILVAPARGN